MANKKPQNKWKSYYTAQYEITKRNKIRELTKRLKFDDKEIINARISKIRNRPNKQKNHR